MSNQQGVAGLHYYPPQNYHHHHHSKPTAQSDYNKIETYPYISEHRNHFHNRPADIQIAPSQNRHIIEDYPSDRGHGPTRDTAPTKRDKKWSFSNLFRRKKKDQTSALSNSSSEDDLLKNKQRSRTKKSSNRSSKTLQRGTFDHIVIPQNVHPHQNTPPSPQSTHYDLKERVVYRERPEEPRLEHLDHVYYHQNGQKAFYSCGNSCESLQSSSKRHNMSSPFSRNSCNSSTTNSNPSNLNSLDSSTNTSSFGRKSRRELAKARVEARRDHLKTESSSEDEERSSQISASSSSATKMHLGSQRSDEGLGLPRSRDSSASRKSRTARTERYHSRRSSKESLHGHTSSQGAKEHSVNSQPSFQNYYSPPGFGASVMQVEVPAQKPEPPPPPPRDPQRRLVFQVGQVDGQNGRPVSYSFENEAQEVVPRVRSIKDLKETCPSLSTTSIQSYNSDLGIPTRNSTGREATPLRSSSVNSEPIRRYIRRHPLSNGQIDKFNYFADHLPRSRKPIIIQASNLGENKYLSDSQIVGSSRSNFCARRNQFEAKSSGQNTNAPLETFKVQVTKEEDGLVSTLALKNTSRGSPVRIGPKPALVTSKSEERDDMRLSNGFSGARTVNSFGNSSDLGLKRTSPSRTCPKPAFVTSKSEERDDGRFSNGFKQTSNEFGHFQGQRTNPAKFQHSKSTEEKNPNPPRQENGPKPESRRSSSNLEDALNELEAIYNSLRLGDEDLLDRAEQQEIQSRLQSKTADPIKFSGSMSDSGFDFDYTERPRYLRGTTGGFSKPISAHKKLPDDMAKRKLQQNQQIPAVAELEKGLTQISYLLASPVHNSIDAFCAVPQKDEPDVTLDDVVFRNIKHINNTLRVVDPQPPFGIPLGPISAAANSDYLHAVPDQEEPKRVPFKANRIPDVVKDDLAYRTLRKDGSKDYGLPQALTADDLLNNNKTSKFCAVFSADAPQNRKNRAVRSLSANIYNLLHGSFEEDAQEFENTFRQLEKAKSNTDLSEEALQASKARNGQPGKVHQRVQVYVPPLYGATNVVVDRKPPSGLLQNAKRANLSPSPVPSIPASNSPRSNLASPTLVDAAKEALESTHTWIPRKETLAVDGGAIKEALETALRTATPTKETCASKTKHSAENKEAVAETTETKRLATPTMETQDVDAVDAIEEAAETKPSVGVSRKGTKATLDKQGMEDAIEVVAEHAKLCEKLLECVIESTELIAPKKAVTEFVPEEEELAEEVLEDLDDLMQKIGAPIAKVHANVTESAENQMATLDVEPITVEMLSETDEHDYENISECCEDKSSASTETQLADAPEQFRDVHKSSEDELLEDVPENVDADRASSCASQKSVLEALKQLGAALEDDQVTSGGDTEREHSREGVQ